MNVDTKELIALEPNEPVPDGFFKIPEQLNPIAQAEMQRAQMVSLKQTFASDASLKSWARNKKKRRKMEKVSRHKNRKKK